MKKKLLLLAGGALILASCGSNNNQTQTQAQIDSAVNAKMAQHDAENAAKNDSILKATEKEKAEAAAKEHHAAKKHETKKEEPAPAPAPPPPPPPPANPKDARFNKNPDGSNKTAPDPNAPNKKADRFK